MDQSIKLPRIIFDAIISQAIEERPRECCGLLGGRDCFASTQYRLTNHSDQPEKKFFASPEDLFDAMRGMRAEGEEFLAIYHSHPNGRPHPSETDIELAFYSEVVYLIVGFDPLIELRAFRIQQQTVSEVMIEVIGEPAPAPPAPEPFESDYAPEAERIPEPVIETETERPAPADLPDDESTGEEVEVETADLHAGERPEAGDLVTIEDAQPHAAASPSSGARNMFMNMWLSVRSLAARMRVKLKPSRAE